MKKIISFELASQVKITADDVVFDSFTNPVDYLHITFLPNGDEIHTKSAYIKKGCRPTEDKK